MKLRSQLTATLLFISLFSAAMVGGIAYEKLVHDFSEAVMENDFDHFQGDVRAYLHRYGSWEAGERNVPFPEFAMLQPHTTTATNSPAVKHEGDTVAHQGRQAFRFLLLDPTGHVLLPGGEFVHGQQVPQELLHKAQPIMVKGRVAALALPLGRADLSSQDLTYLAAMRRALLIGFLTAGSLALLLGLLFGRRMSHALDELTRAIRALHPGGKLMQVTVHSRDEIGELATAFNRMSAELDHAHRELRELSIRDPLTQLYNRRHFGEQSTHLYEQARRYGHPLTVMVGDLDHFKQINDRFSHAVGDEVLRHIGELLNEHTRKSDLLARHGGEEFVIAFAETTLSQAYAYCEHLRQRIEAHPWQEIHPELKVTMSMGLNADSGLDSVEKMLMAADSQLYAAKAAGRNRVLPVLATAAIG